MSSTTQQAHRNNSNAAAGGKATLTPTAIEDVHSAQQLELTLSMPAPAGNQANRPGSASAIESFVTADGTDTGDTPAGAAQATSADPDTHADAADATASSAKPLTASNEQPPEVTIDDATDDEATETKRAHLATPTGRRSEAQPHALQDAKSKRKTQSDQDVDMAGHVKDDNSHRKKDVKSSHAVPSVTEIFGSIRRSITAPSTSKRASVADAALPNSPNEAKRTALPAAPIEPKLEADAAKSAKNPDAKKKRRESLMLLTRKIGGALNSPTGKDADNLALDTKTKGQQDARASKSSAQHRETPKPKLADEAAASQTLASAQMASVPGQVSKQPIVTPIPLEPSSQLPPLPGPDLGIQPTDPIVAPGEPRESTSNTLPPLPGPFLGPPPPALIAAEAKAKALYGQLKRRMSVVFGASPTQHHPAAASTVGPQPAAQGAKEDAQSAGSALLTSGDAGKAIILNADGSSQVVQATTKGEGEPKIKQAPSAGGRAETSDAAHAQKDEKSSSFKKSRPATLSNSFRRLASHQMATPGASDALSKSVPKHSGKEVGEHAHAARAQSDHVTAGSNMQSGVLKDEHAMVSAPLSTGQVSEGQDNMLATFGKLLHRPLPHTPKANARGEADAESANDADKPATLNARGVSQRRSKDKSNKSTLAGSASVLGAFRSKLGQYRAPTGPAGWSHSPKTAAPATAYANGKGAQGKVAAAKGQEAAKHASKKDGQNAKEDAEVKDAHNSTSSSNAGNPGASAVEAKPYDLGDDSEGKQVEADVQESDAIEPRAVAGNTAAQADREIKA
ncbi:hypothetical protein IE81DRAFT_126173 [Ceraceosorus guamensis]|uniref:Uncharacterized protein n=1 Tax=Ceraceosorus guamensis TaxID=1522189 RepID=A0A316WEF4_9BASI|nr:hypothetical protein IE81DRAFT_126173 [Ceraceosorus guamensis]PWN45775.1 hypothetical protein IE81DRAFT_126173 [Ceraceosorus guamensis]